ncbi:hypothetical protein [Ideonella sp. YS5]|uniref:hypothetical protein n=1 Tax=Ideonella sp. YS5 TaxID=3453714 RepID=UPI003EEA9E1C
MTRNAESGDLVLLFGNSHANCMANALRSKLAPVMEDEVGIRVVSTGSEAFPGGLTVTDSMGRKMANPVVTRAIQQALAEQRGRRVWLASVVGGNQANRLSLFEGGERVAFLDPDDPDAQAPHGNCIFVPYDLIEYQLARSMESCAEMYRLLPLDKVAGLVHLEGPPPVPDSRFIVEHLPDRTRELFRARGITRIGPEDVAPIEFRHAVWRAQCRISRRVSEACGGRYLPPPDEVFGSDGYRRAELCADATHATAEYGAAYLGALRRFVMEGRARHHV